MPALSADHLSRSYGSDLVLRDISLTIELGESVALLGVNGAGKSTLGRILAGWEEPDTGVLARRRDLGLAYLPQEPVLDPSLTVYATVEASLSRWKATMAAYESVSEALSRGEGDPEEAVARQTALAQELESLGGWQVRHRVERVLESLQLRRLEQPVGELSGGERRRVALAKILLAAPGFAVLDEPTNHLDADTCAWLETWLREEFTGALLLITHDRYLLDRVVTRVLELDRGVVHSHDGAYGAYLAARVTRLALEDRAHTRQLNLLRREEDWLSRGPPARTRKSKARIDSALALAEEVKGHPRREEAPAFTVASARAAKRLLSCEGLSKGYGGRALFEGLGFHLSPGERVGIVGPNGAGKTTLLRVLLGDEAPDAGEVTRAPSLKVAYFDQARAGLDDALSVYDTIAEGSDRVAVGDRHLTVHAYLDLFLFDSHRSRQRVGSLSGGERARVALARMLRGEANLLVLDEPTNDLDLFALTALEELLSGFPGAALVVTHDRWFLDRVATSLLYFEPDGRVVQYAGGWDDCLLQRASAARSAALASPAPSRPPPAREPKRAPAVKTLTPPEARELESLPAQVDAAEAELSRREARLNDPGLYARGPAEVARCVAEAEAQREVVRALTARWEALEARRG